MWQIISATIIYVNPKSMSVNHPHYIFMITQNVFSKEMQFILTYLIFYIGKCKKKTTRYEKGTPQHILM